MEKKLCLTHLCPASSTPRQPRSLHAPSASSGGDAEHLRLKMHLQLTRYFLVLSTPCVALRQPLCGPVLHHKPLNLEVLSVQPPPNVRLQVGIAALDCLSQLYEVSITYWERHGGTQGQQVCAW